MRKDINIFKVKRKKFIAMQYKYFLKIKTKTSKIWFPFLKNKLRFSLFKNKFKIIPKSEEEGWWDET